MANKIDDLRVGFALGGGAFGDKSRPTGSAGLSRHPEKDNEREDTHCRALSPSKIQQTHKK